MAMKNIPILNQLHCVQKGSRGGGVREKERDREEEGEGGKGSYWHTPQ